jgi:predicted dehydrogenase
VKDSYLETKLHQSVDGYDGAKPDAVFVGTPPSFRGTMIPGRNIDVVVSQKWPSAAIFLEKPVSSERVGNVRPLAAFFNEMGTLVTVGYMLRYLKGMCYIVNC